MAYAGIRLGSCSTWSRAGCSVAVPLSVAYAVVKHGVFGVKVAIRRGIQYLLARRALQALLAVPIGALLYTLVSYRQRTIAELVTGTTAYLYWILALGLSLRFRRAAPPMARSEVLPRAVRQRAGGPRAGGRAGPIRLGGGDLPLRLPAAGATRSIRSRCTSGGAEAAS